MKENKDYELILSEDTTENWNVRILTGDFVETVIEYKAIAFNEIKDHLSFNYNIISSPFLTTKDAAMFPFRGELIILIIPFPPLFVTR